MSDQERPEVQQTTHDPQLLVDAIRRMNQRAQTSHQTARVMQAMLRLAEFQLSIQHIAVDLCPFCNNRAEVKKLSKLNDDATQLYRVECLDVAECFATGPMRETPESAAAGWNHRPDVVIIVEQVKRYIDAYQSMTYGDSQTDEEAAAVAQQLDASLEWLVKLSSTLRVEIVAKTRQPVSTSVPPYHQELLDVLRRYLAARDAREQIQLHEYRTMQGSYNGDYHPPLDERLTELAAPYYYLLADLRRAVEHAV